MSDSGIDWSEGAPHLQQCIEAWTAGGVSQSSERLHRSPQRTLDRLDTGPREVVLKVHHTHTGRHPIRESIKRAIGRSPARTEWQALARLHARGVPVPEPLARGRLANGDEILVTQFLEGRDLKSVFAVASAEERLLWVDRIAAAVADLHAAGFRHGDLHLGNLFAHHDELMILDFQRATTARGRREQLRDLAQLDFSIARLGAEVECRRRLRRALGEPSGLDEASRRFVRDFLRGRSRRELNLSSNWIRWHPLGSESEGTTNPDPVFRGLRTRASDASRLDCALEAAINDPRPGDRRGGRTRITIHEGDGDGDSLITKRTISSTRRRLLPHLLGRSPALRSFEIGQRLELLGELGAKSLGAVEEFVSGRPVADWLFMESSGRVDLDAYQPRSEAEAVRCAIALADWVAEWHAWGIDHRDLKAGNIRIDDHNGDYRFWLIDLGDVRFRHRPNDRARRRALVQLNASLSDEAFSIGARRAALDAYLARLPFRGIRKEQFVEEIVQESLARAHRWRGEGCRAATSGISRSWPQ